MKKAVDILSLIIFLVVCIISVLFPKHMSFYVIQSLRMCAGTVIPALFPFLVISRLLSESSVAERAGRIISPIISVLFGVDKNLCGSFLIGMFAGFPNGAISTAITYSKGNCSKDCAQRNLALCNNCSLPFLATIAGVAILGSVKYGIILIASQIMTVFITSIIIRFCFKKSNACDRYIVKSSIFEKKSKNNLIIKSLKDATLNMLYICGLISVFYTLSGVLCEIFKDRFDLIFITKSLFEVTSAVDMCKSVPFPLNIVLCSAAIGFSGICVILQVADICEKYKLSPKYFVISRFISAVVMPLCTVILLLLAPRDAISVFAGYDAQYYLSSYNIEAITLIYAITLILVMLISGLMYCIATVLERNIK